MRVFRSLLLLFIATEVVAVLPDLRDMTADQIVGQIFINPGEPWSPQLNSRLNEDPILRRKVLHRYFRERPQPLQIQIRNLYRSEFRLLAAQSRQSSEDMEVLKQLLGEMILNPDKEYFYEISAFVAHPLSDIRQLCYEALSRIKDDRVFPIIARLAVSVNPVERIYALDAYFYLKDERTVPYLLNALKDENKSVRFFAIRTLEEMQRTEAIAVFLRIISEDINNEVRIKTIQVIGDFRPPAAFTPLTRLVTDPDPAIRHEVLVALQKYRNEAAAYPVSEQLARENESELKLEMIRLLLFLKNSGGMNGLNRIMQNDPDKTVRLWSVYATGILKDARGYNTLTSLIDDPDPDIATEATIAAGRFQNKSLSVKMLDLVRSADRSYPVQSAALWALSEIAADTSMYPLLEISQSHPDKIIRVQSAEVLKSLLRRRF